MGVGAGQGRAWARVIGRGGLSGGVVGGWWWRRAGRGMFGNKAWTRVLNMYVLYVLCKVLCCKQVHGCTDCTHDVDRRRIEGSTVGGEGEGV